jgi:hypothetical protein
MSWWGFAVGLGWTRRATSVAGSVGLTRRMIHGGDPLILGYQKSRVTPMDHPASECNTSPSPKSNRVFVSSSSAVAGIGGQRFLVPQYEAAANTSRCAG